MIDVVMTAAVRPDIVRRTLESLLNNVQTSHEFCLVVDIAPVGEIDQYTQYDVEQVIKKYFPKAIIKISDDSPQTVALYWTWLCSTSEWVLQLEDDWVFDRPFNLDIMIEYARKFRGKRINQIYIDRHNKSVLNYPPYQGLFSRCHDDDRFWVRNIGKSFGGPPALLNQKYMIEVCQEFLGWTTYECLDVMCRRNDCVAFLKTWDTLVYTGDDGFGHLAIDIGKKWKEQHGIKMVKRTERGVQWNPA